MLPWLFFDIQIASFPSLLFLSNISNLRIIFSKTNSSNEFYHMNLGELAKNAFCHHIWRGLVAVLFCATYFVHCLEK